MIFPLTKGLNMSLNYRVKITIIGVMLLQAITLSCLIQVSMKIVKLTGFKLAVHNLQIAKHFGSLQMSFCIFSKNCKLLNQILHEFSELFIELAV